MPRERRPPAAGVESMSTGRLIDGLDCLETRERPMHLRRVDAPHAHDAQRLVSAFAMLAMTILRPSEEPASHPMLPAPLAAAAVEELARRCLARMAAMPPDVNTPLRAALAELARAAVAAVAHEKRPP